MGLDITVYRQLRQVTDLPPAESDELYELLHVYNIADFAGREAPLIDGAYYDGEAVEGFRAGSYSGYNNWRDWLAKIAGWPKHSSSSPHHVHCQSAWCAEGGPFWELINFADNEGVIGSTVAAKLAKDFADFEDAAKNDCPEDEWFYDSYCRWREAFDVAADGGAVSFH